MQKTKILAEAPSSSAKFSFARLKIKKFFCSAVIET